MTPPRTKRKTARSSGVASTCALAGKQNTTPRIRTATAVSIFAFRLFVFMVHLVGGCALTARLGMCIRHAKQVWKDRL